jgi:hypothetical protein
MMIIIIWRKDCWKLEPANRRSFSNAIKHYDCVTNQVHFYQLQTLNYLIYLKTTY